MLTLFVNNNAVEVKNGSTVIQACEQAGVEIPRFCYHPKILIAGNCRMCLVEIKGSPKPVASCAMPAAPNQEIFTDTPLVKKAREAVLEFLIVNHPLDCPICDQGGECDLQDQAMEFGSDSSRFYHTQKRSVEDKNCGPLIKTIMTRCIHCTRCVRFSSEVAGVGDLGTTGRGIDTEIGFYVEKLFKSEISGNVIDLCPVGALTSKPYAFKARPWELRSVDTVDFSDGMGANIRVDSKGLEVIRVTPRANDSINEEWISDKTRFSFDAFKRQRLETPYIKKKHISQDINAISDNGDELVPISWKLALNKLVHWLVKCHDNESKMESLAGSMMTVETSNAFSEFSKNVLKSTPRSLDITKQPDLESKYLFNPTFLGIEKADVVLTVGTNIRTEAPLINARLRKQWLKDNVSVAHIGPTLNLTFPVNHLGLTSRTFVDVAQGKHSFSKELLKAENPMIIFSPSFFRQENLQAYKRSLDIIVDSIPNIQTPDWNGLAVLDIEANTSATGFIPTSFLEGSSVKRGITFLLNSDDRLGYKRDFIENEKVESYLFDRLRDNSEWLVYAGHHGTELTAKADLVLPTSIYLENEGHHLNMEGRYQQSAKVTTSPGKTQNDIELIDVIRYLFNQQIGTCNNKQASVTNSDYYLFEPTAVQCQDFSSLVHKPKGLAFNETNLSRSDCLKSAPVIQYLNDAPLKPVVTEFYQTDTISKHSSTMSDCSKKYGSTINFQE